MLAILFGKQSFMVKSQLKKLENSFFNDEEHNVINMDADSFSFLNVIDECQQMNLTCSKKMVIYSKCTFLSSLKGNKISFKNDKKDLLKYFEHDSDDVLLVFVVLAESLLKRNEIVNYIEKKGKIYELKDLKGDDWPIFIKKYFSTKNITISQGAIDELTSRCSSDLYLFHNEVNKLLLYKENNINIDDVRAIVSRPLEDNVFEILNNLLANRKDLALSSFRDLKVNGAEPVVLISLISKSLIFLDEVYYLSDNKKMKSDEIARTLGTSSGRIYFALKNLKGISYSKIKKAFDKLFKLDCDIKHGRYDASYGFELFILNF